jgi:hypothetical protein
LCIHSVFHLNSNGSLTISCCSRTTMSARSSLQGYFWQLRAVQFKWRQLSTELRVLFRRQFVGMLSHERLRWVCFKMIHFF